MQKKERMANLEVLRCVAMMMVVVLHYLGKGGLLPDLTAPLSVQDMVAWLLEACCIVAVNVYMMISGYFLCESSFKLSRLLTLWLQLWLYSVGIGVLAVVTGIVPAAEVSTHYYLTLLFPVTMGHYWFLTAYLFLYILLPFVGMGLRRMTKQQFQVALVLLFVTFCLLKSVLPFRLEEDGKGYDCLWYLCVFCAAAYLRRFGIPFLQKKSRALLLYLIGIFGTFGEAMLLHLFYLKTGSLELILKIPYEYNHIFPFLASLGLFCLFLDSSIQGKIGSVAVRIAPYTLGVYLLHENLGVRYAWQKWLAKQGYDYIKPEFTYGKSRIDFYMEKGEQKYLMEVKGCTLEVDGIGYFPDAPTERGVKHLHELAQAQRKGYQCAVAFVIQMEGITEVRPNVSTQPEFGTALAEAKAAGVQVLFLLCRVGRDSLEIVEQREG